MNKCISLVILAALLISSCGQGSSSSSNQSPTPTPMATESAAVPSDDTATSATTDASLVITPGVGVGELQFGMTKAQMIEVLGEPEREMRPGTYEYMSKGMAILGAAKDPKTMRLAR